MKKITKGILLLFLSTILLAGCGQQSAQEDRVLHVGYSGSLCEAPVHMAQEKGFFERLKEKLS